jgi:hypothetical protein
MLPRRRRREEREGGRISPHLYELSRVLRRCRTAATAPELHEGAKGGKTRAVAKCCSGARGRHVHHSGSSAAEERRRRCMGKVSVLARRARHNDPLAPAASSACCSSLRARTAVAQRAAAPQQAQHRCTRQRAARSSQHTQPDASERRAAWRCSSRRQPAASAPPGRLFPVRHPASSRRPRGVLQTLTASRLAASAHL